MDKDSYTLKSDDELRRIDLLAKRVIGGDTHARDQLMEIFAKPMAQLAKWLEWKTSTCTTDAGDYEQVGWEVFLKAFEKWPKVTSGAPFYFYVLSKAKWEMMRVERDAAQPTSRSTVADTVRQIKNKLENELEREIGVHEIYQYMRDNLESKSHLSKDTIAAALSVYLPPRHFDYQDVLSSEDEESSLMVSDSYFGGELDDEDTASNALKDELKGLLADRVGALYAHRRSFIERYLETDGDIPTLTAEFGYKDDQATRAAIKKATEDMRRVDETSPKYIERVERAKIRETVRENPHLLESLPPKRRLYFEDELAGLNYTEIAEKHGVSTVAINGQYGAMTVAYEQLSKAKVCNKCWILKSHSDFHTRTKNGKKALQPYCKDCKREIDKKYSAAKVERKEKQKVFEKEKGYQAWLNMRKRCDDPTSHLYAEYGERGISVCERWENYENFLADMGPKLDKCKLDRIDNDGDFEPGNCRWVPYHFKKDS